MLKFSISINGGTEIEINEPVGFDKVDFNLTRSEELHSISSSFAGNSIEFEFNNKVHYNIFDNIISAYEVDGYLANVKLYVYWNNTAIFIGDFDFSTTQTDMANYIKCQIVKKDKLYLLDKNKGVAVDLLGDKDLDDSTADIAPMFSVGLPPITLKKESIWEDKEVRDYFVYTDGVTFNNAQNTTKYEINDSITWMSFSEPYAGNAGRNFQLISAKENLVNLEITIEYTSGTYFQALSSATQMQLWLYYGQERPDLNNGDWDLQINSVLLDTVNVPAYPSTINLPSLISYNIPAIPRGSGVWVFWRSSGGGAMLHNTGTKITITADAKNYYSVTDSIKYKDLVANAVKKIANINNVQWNINYYDNTLSFNGNLIRHINDKGFTIKWQDIAKQLNERNLGAYYNESTDTLVIDHRNNILGSNDLGLFGDYAKKEFYFVTEDEKFIVNSFKYKYSKYQALKENSVDGNYSSVHGETEWYIANKTFEGDISVDLPFIRDSFMIEDIRIKALAYKEDTATNEDSTIILLESQLNNPKLTVEETIVVNSNWNLDTGQNIQNDGSFNWDNIGLYQNQVVFINDEIYEILSIDKKQLILLPMDTNDQELNGMVTIVLRYDLDTDMLANLQNGLYNQQFSVRQNILYWQNTLGVANYYAKKPIINTLYKENKNAGVYGLIENSDIDFNEPLHKPRVIETKVLISVDDYFYLSNNKIGFIKIYNSKDEEISIYLTELKALFLNGCDQMEANIKGWLKNEIPLPPPIVTNTIVTRSTVGDLFYTSLNFVFNDVTERITIRNGSAVLYSNLYYSQICAPNECFSDYLGTKNYLLSL